MAYIIPGHPSIKQKALKELKETGVISNTYVHTPEEIPSNLIDISELRKSQVEFELYKKRNKQIISTIILVVLLVIGVKYGL